MSGTFRRLAQFVSLQAGSPWVALSAFLLVLLWLASGPWFGYSDHWQLIINTGTTIVTFLMVFLIQNAQNRDAKALHLKLDELIRGVQGARTFMVRLEQCSDEELDRLQVEFNRLRAREAQRAGASAP
jgi:low affinity Fe/Cu permease